MELLVLYPFFFFSFEKFLHSYAALQGNLVTAQHLSDLRPPSLPYLRTLSLSLSPPPESDLIRPARTIPVAAPSQTGIYIQNCTR